MLIILAAAVLISPDAFANGDPDGVVATAPRDVDAVLVGAQAPTAGVVPDAVGARVTQESLTTQQQIDRWIGAREPVGVAPFHEEAGVRDDREVHGFVSGSIGSGDFSDVTVGVSLPVGENGRLDMSYSQTRNGYYDYPYGGGYGYGAYPLAEHSYPLDAAFAPSLIYPGRGLGYGYGRGGGYASSAGGRSFSPSYRSDPKDEGPGERR